jgi:hypothetical protein
VPTGSLLGEQGYDADHLRRILGSRRNDRWDPNKKTPTPVRRHNYQVRNVIERTYCRLKVFR